MNIWLDDLREAPENWIRTHDVEETIGLLKDNKSHVEAISLDHDLGEDQDGVDVLKWLEQQHKQDDAVYWPKWVMIHSSNAVGRENMRRIIESSSLYGNRITGIVQGGWSGIEGYERI